MRSTPIINFNNDAHKFKSFIIYHSYFFFVILYFYFIFKIITDEKRNIMRARRMETQKR